MRSVCTYSSKDSNDSADRLAAYQMVLDPARTSANNNNWITEGALGSFHLSSKDIHELVALVNELRDSHSLKEQTLLPRLIFKV